jgi:hypothetical protein
LAEAEVRQAVAGQTPSHWVRGQRLLGPQAFAFLDHVHEQLAALRGEHAPARVARGVLLAAGLVPSLAGEAGQQVPALVRRVLDTACRSSSLVEGLNRVLCMQQARQKRLTQELLDLKRLDWNLHACRAGARKGSTPYGRQGLAVPPGSW